MILGVYSYLTPGSNNIYIYLYKYIYIIEGSLEAKLPTKWTDGKAQPARSSDMEKVRRRKSEMEKVRKGDSQKRRCRCTKR